MPLPEGIGVQSPLDLALPLKSWLKFRKTEAEVHQVRAKRIRCCGHNPHSALSQDGAGSM